MPCSDNYGPSENCQTQERLDKVTRLLCGLCQRLESLDGENLLIQLFEDRNTPNSDELRQWWKEHQEADRKREDREKEEKRQEAVRQRALNKLSSEEKLLLNLRVRKHRIGTEQ